MPLGFAILTLEFASHRSQNRAKVGRGGRVLTDYRSQPLADTIREIDTTPLRNLLRMAGPANAPTIITAFLDDLKSTEIGLDPAWNGPDYAALRLHAHVLIALAGTVGDTYLQAIAQNLNAFARDHDFDKIHAMKAQTMHGLAELITTLATFTPREK